MPNKDFVTVSEVHILRNVIYNDSVYGSIIKLFYVSDGVQFGLDANRNWVQTQNDNKYINLLENDTPLVGLDNSMLTLLEINLKKFIGDLEAALKANNIPCTLTETFPYELIIQNGLLSESDWWVNLSLDWLMEQPIKQQYNYNVIIDLVEKIKNSKAYEQKNRQKANKFLIKYHRSI